MGGGGTPSLLYDIILCLQIIVAVKDDHMYDSTHVTDPVRIKHVSTNCNSKGGGYNQLSFPLCIMTWHTLLRMSTCVTPTMWQTVPGWYHIKQLPGVQWTSSLHNDITHTLLDEQMCDSKHVTDTAQMISYQPPGSYHINQLQQQGPGVQSTFLSAL